MSKYNKLWEYIEICGKEQLILTFEEINSIAGVPLDHSFLKYKKELLEYIRTENKQVYRKLRHSLFGRVMNLPGRSGRKMSVAAYKISQKFYGFN